MANPSIGGFQRVTFSGGSGRSCMRPGPGPLTWLSTLALALGALAACTKENTPGRVSFALYDCDSAISACQRRPPEWIEAAAIVSPQGSRTGARGGVRVEAQISRASGVTGVLSLDLAPGRPTSATYTEWANGARVFTGVGEGGRVVIGPDASGRFAMRFVDPGPDGQRGTSDDRVRSLLDGVYWLSPAVTTSVGPLPYIDWSLDWIDVVETDPGYDGATDSSGCGGTSSSDWSGDPSSDPTSDPSNESSSGCGSDTSAGPPSDSSSGCASDSSTDGSSGSSSDSSSGCGGSGSDSSSSSGCGGDSSSASDCNTEQRGAAPGRAHARRRVGGAGRFYPAFAVAFLCKLRPRRKRATPER